MTERAHAASLVTKVSDAMRHLPATSKSSPFGRAGAGAPERAFPKSSDDFFSVFLPKAAMVMHLNFNRSYIKKVYDGEDPDDGTIGMAAYVNG